MTRKIRNQNASWRLKWAPGRAVRPYEGHETKRAQRASPRAVLSLVGFAALRSIVCTVADGLLDSHRPRRLTFFRWEVRTYHVAVPRSTNRMGSSFRKLRAPSESSRSAPAWCLATPSAFRGVACPLRDIGWQRLTPGFQTRRPASTAFRTLAMLSLPALWVYFTPLPRSGFALQGLTSNTAASPRR